MKNELMVTVQCCVYNHKPYIRQCLDGIVMQKTNFRFEAIVHDDASTDGTASIIKEYAEKYPNIIKPIFEIENQFSKRDGTLTRIMNEHSNGKYIAICEGDDYWTDPLKLQKQVDLINSDADCSLCYSKAKVYNQNANRFESYVIGKSFNSFKDLLIENKIPTLTTLFKKDLYLEYLNSIKPGEKQWKMGDYPMWLWFSLKSKILFLDEVTAVYRVLENSASHSKDIKKEESFCSSTKDICLYFTNLYPEYEYLTISIYDNYYRSLSKLGEKYNNKQYCIDNLCKIRGKTKKEILKIVLYKIPGFYVILNLYRRIRKSIV